MMNIWGTYMAFSHDVFIVLGVGTQAVVFVVISASFSNEDVNRVPLFSFSFIRNCLEHQ